MYDAFFGHEFGHMARVYSGNRDQVQDVSAAHFPRKNRNKELPVISVYVDRTPCLTLLDPG